MCGAKLMIRMHCESLDVMQKEGIQWMARVHVQNTKHKEQCQKYSRLSGNSRKARNAAQAIGNANGLKISSSAYPSRAATASVNTRE